jgi:hypothetical protein
MNTKLNVMSIGYPDGVNTVVVDAVGKKTALIALLACVVTERAERMALDATVVASTVCEIVAAQQWEAS